MNNQRNLKRTHSFDSIFENLSYFSNENEQYFSTKNEDQEDLNNTFCYGSSIKVIDLFIILNKFYFI